MTLADHIIYRILIDQIICMSQREQTTSYRNLSGQIILKIRIEQISTMTTIDPAYCKSRIDLLDPTIVKQRGLAVNLLLDPTIVKQRGLEVNLLLDPTIVKQRGLAVNLLLDPTTVKQRGLAVNLLLDPTTVKQRGLAVNRTLVNPSYRVHEGKANKY